MTKIRHGLGSEHRLCDRIQLLMLILFFVAWGADSLSFYMFGYSTVISGVFAFPALLAGTILFLCLSVYLVSKSHKAVLEQISDPPVLVVSGVYAWVRHPMYLGSLFFCLSFLFISASLVAVVIWIAFFVFYDRMATYEEESLTKMLGNRYIAYKKRVSKWIPKIY